MLSFLAVQIYIATIIGGMLINASLPLAFEMGSELAFPVSEGIVGGTPYLFDQPVWNHIPTGASNSRHRYVFIIADLHIIMMLQIFITCTSFIYRGQEITI